MSCDEHLPNIWKKLLEEGEAGSCKVAHLDEEVCAVDRFLLALQSQRALEQCLVLRQRDESLDVEAMEVHEDPWLRDYSDIRHSGKHLTYQSRTTSGCHIQQGHLSVLFSK